MSCSRLIALACALALLAPGGARAQEAETVVRWTSPDGRVTVVAPPAWSPQRRLPDHVPILVTPPGFDEGRDMRVCALRAEEADPTRATPLSQAELNARMEPWWRQSRWREANDTVHSTSIEEVEGVRVFFYDRQSGLPPGGFREVVRSFILADGAGGTAYIVSCRVQLDAMSDGRFAEVNDFVASLVINPR